MAGILTDIRLSDDTTDTSGQILAVIDEAMSAITATESSSTRNRPTAIAATLTDTSSQVLSKAEQLATPSGGRSAASQGPIHSITKNELPASAPVEKAPIYPRTIAIDHALRSERRAPMSHLRATITERLIQAQVTHALTSFNEVDLSVVNELRGRYRNEFERNMVRSWGYMYFFSRAYDAQHSGPCRGG